MMTLAQARALLPDSTLVGDGSVRIDRVHTDTRTLLPGDLFVALKGERFDAHSYLAQARTNGAVAAIAVHGLSQAGLPGLLVDDTQLALAQLATAWRRQFRRYCCSRHPDLHHTPVAHDLRRRPNFTRFRGCSMRLGAR